MIYYGNHYNGELIMSQGYRIIIQKEQNNGTFDSGDVVYEGEYTHPSTLMQLGLRHATQINILSALQESILKSQSVDLQESIQYCPNCGYEVIRNGTNHSTFNAVFTDHKIPVHRLKCTHCHWNSVPSIKSLFGSQLHPDLVKLQCEHGSKESYSVAQTTLNAMCAGKRSVNNAMSLRKVVEMVGNYAADHPDKTLPKNIPAAKKLIIQVDGGHVASKDKTQRSFEALTSVVYKPEAIIPGKKKRTTGSISSKHCAASSVKDEGKYINELTLVAAKKEGLTTSTHITALCDGADNCWKIIDSLKPHAASITEILDWFHIAKKFQNVRMGESKNKALIKAKFALWHGNVDKALDKLHALLISDSQIKQKDRLASLIGYINNNRKKIVNYEKRYKEGEAITSQMAESTVESLINQRCKGKRHMQWSPEGLHPVLQLRALASSNDWNINWQHYVIEAYAKAA